MPDLTELLGLLKSPDPEERSRGVERAAVAIERLVHAVVDSVEGSAPNQRYVADHVHRFGTLMVPPMEALLARSEDADTASLCSILLLRLHSRAGVDRLLAAVADGGSWTGPAARALAEAGVREAAEPILHRLRTGPLDRAHEIDELLHALEQLDHSIPSDLVTRFQSPDAPPAARARVEAVRSATSGGESPS